VATKLIISLIDATDKQMMKGKNTLSVFFSRIHPIAVPINTLELMRASW
jgi:hypothetical protein